MESICEDYTGARLGDPISLDRDKHNTKIARAAQDRRYMNFQIQFSNMAKVIEAIYEKGVFKPLERVDLKEGEIVEIEIKEKRAGDRFYRVLEEL